LLSSARTTTERRWKRWSCRVDGVRTIDGFRTIDGVRSTAATRTPDLTIVLALANEARPKVI
jgi:hypothetical protein